jgi:hypothetical protein
VQLARSPDCFTCPLVLFEAEDNERIHRAIFVFVSLSKKMRFSYRRTKSGMLMNWKFPTECPTLMPRAHSFVVDKTRGRARATQVVFFAA